MGKPPAPPLFFNPKEMGRSLREVASDIIKTESQDVKSRWFHSNQDIDLYIWQDEFDNVIKQQLSFHGQIAEWNLIEGLKTGFIFEDESVAKTASEIVRYDDTLQKGTLLQAIELLQCIDVLSSHERQLLLENFRRNPSLGHISPEEFLKKYKRMDLPPPAPRGFFAQLVKRIRSIIGR